MSCTAKYRGAKNLVAPIEERDASLDLFISYADADRAWVEGYLLDALTQAGVRCHSEAAFALGVPRLLEFERAVQGSQRTLLILSPAYLAEGFGQANRNLTRAEWNHFVGPNISYECVCPNLPPQDACTDTH